MASQARSLTETSDIPSGAARHFCEPVMLRSTPHSSVRTSMPAMAETVSSMKSAPASRASLPTSAAAYVVPVDVSLCTSEMAFGRERSVVLDRRRLIHRLDHGEGELGRPRDHQDGTRHALGPVQGGDRHGRILTVRRLAVDEVEVPRVDEQPRALAEDEDGVTPVERVEQERDAAADGEIPELFWDDAFLFALGGDPLNEEASREERLADEADREPHVVRCHAGAALSWS